MKKLIILLLIFTCSLMYLDTQAQCSICTRTAMQMGHKPAQGLNDGILFLMAIPYLAIGVVGYKWWKNRDGMVDED